MVTSTKSASGQYTESGDYDFTLEAQERDSISLWYQHGTMESPSNDFVIKLVPATP